VFARSGRRLRTRRVHIGRLCAFVARARSSCTWAVNDSMSLVCLDDCERVGTAVARCWSTAELWMRTAEAVTSLLPARVVIGDCGATITGGGVSEMNSESGSSMFVAVAAVRSRRAVEPETMIRESGPWSNVILAPVTKANSVTLTPTSHGVKPVGSAAQGCVDL
jgi:hypothetical protein